jgi:hypothetical protein
MNITDYNIEKIGIIYLGVDGSDAFHLFTNLSDNIDFKTFENDVLEFYYDHGSSNPGSYFCHSVEVFKRTENQALVIVHHRYNV